MQAGQLGSVLFQFHVSFGPSAAHRQHVEWCRRRLDARVAMSVEFRSRTWFDNETERQSTAVRLLKCPMSEWILALLAPANLFPWSAHIVRHPGFPHVSGP